MKKNFTLLFGMLAFYSLSTLAQNAIAPIEMNGEKEPLKNKNEKTLMPLLQAASNASRWYNYGEAADAFLGGAIGGGPGLYKGNFLFPDSTLLVNYGSGPGAPWIHCLADVLDVTSLPFNESSVYGGELMLDKTKAFRLDSLGVRLFYGRNINDPSIVDTLVVEVATNVSLTNSYFTSAQLVGNLNTDTAFFRRLPYTSSTNNLNLTKKTIKFPLTQEVFADSLEDGSHYITLSTGQGGINCNAGSQVVSSVSFIPGYTWTPNVDMMDDKNNIYFLSLKENPDNFMIYEKKDWNISYLASITVRYDKSTTGWNGYFIPSLAYMGGTTATYNYEHHAIYYKVTDPNVAVPQLEKGHNGLSLSQNIPNPASKQTSVVYELSAPTKVSFKIVDLTGKEIMTLNEGEKTIGQHKLDFNTSLLSAGIYYYTLQTNEGSISRKMIISE
jgi:hypothetical protein